MVHDTRVNHYAIRDDDWLLIDAKTGYLRQAPESWNEKHNQPADNGQPVELYNLKKDIRRKSQGCRRC